MGLNCLRHMPQYDAFIPCVSMRRWKSHVEQLWLTAVAVVVWSEIFLLQSSRAVQQCAVQRLIPVYFGTWFRRFRSHGTTHLRQCILSFWLRLRNVRLLCCRAALDWRVMPQEVYCHHWRVGFETHSNAQFFQAMG